MAKTNLQDLTQEMDTRGDYPLFIEEKHFISEWTLDEEAANAVGIGTRFIRVIKDGVEQASHGWAEGNTVVQWG